MTEQTSAEQAKRQSRGWSDTMDSVSIARRLAKLEELIDCWKSLREAKPILPKKPIDPSPIPGSSRTP
jgi:hypothetical protein